MTNIHAVVAAVSPDVYCHKSVRAKVKSIVKKEGYVAAAKEAKVIEPDDMTFDAAAAYRDPLNTWGKKYPIERHTLVYDSFSEQLEPVYFWLLDFLQKSSDKVTKVVDTFVSSPGSGHYGEFGQKRTRMQEEGMKILGTVGQMVKSVLNIVYDLKDFEIRLALYDNLKSDKPATKESAILSLKQIWMDTVDFAKRGTTSLKQLAAQYDYVTVIDAFMKAKTLEEVKELDLNDRVKHIVMQRVDEFYMWLRESERELRKRYSIEKQYLKNQVDTINMYSRWVYPYLRAATQLEMSDNNARDLQSDPSLVNIFSTTLQELTLVASGKYDPKDDLSEGLLPKIYKRPDARTYHPLVIVELKYRTMPQRINQRGDYSYGGKVEMKFTSYALNDEELKMFHETIKDTQFGEVMKLIEGATTETLKHIKEDIDHFLDKKEEKKEDAAEEKEKPDDLNPFTALFGSLFGKKKDKKKPDEKKDLTKGIESDDKFEEVFRSQAILMAREKCYRLYDVYKKAHGMASHADPFET